MLKDTASTIDRLNRLNRLVKWLLDIPIDKRYSVVLFILLGAVEGGSLKESDLQDLMKLSSEFIDGHTKLDQLQITQYSFIQSGLFSIDRKLADMMKGGQD